MNPARTSFSCPLPLRDYPQVLLAHGGGGRLMQQLLDEVILRAFGNTTLASQHDSAVLANPSAKLAFTTDSFVVRPMFFPGGDVGSLAIHGTVNDLAMSGARPLWLSASFIIEEGLSMETLWRIVQSMSRAAEQCEVRIVTGDTKVVERGKGDGLFINTAGIGAVEHSLTITPQSIEPGDIILVNGDVGRHGMAVMAVREGLEFESTITSDSTTLWPQVQALLVAGVEVKCLRDITRGGMTSALNEIASAGRQSIEVVHSTIPVRTEVASACEILGLDVLQVACEGRFLAFVSPREAERALKILRAFDDSAAIIGEVLAGEPRVILRTELARRILDVPAGEQLPRIC